MIAFMLSSKSGKTNLYCCKSCDGYLYRRPVGDFWGASYETDQNPVGASWAQKPFCVPSFLFAG